DFAKLAAMTAIGWLFLRYFEDASWVVLVAFIVPWVDAYSVWRGPTHEIVHHRENVFSTLSFAFPVPGSNGSAKLGLPDLLFFAKLAAMTAIGWLFLRYFEDASWVVLVAFIVPWVDAYSVWRGPTHEIVHHRENVFSTLSFAFPVPGSNGSAKLGLPDLLFFA